MVLSKSPQRTPLGAVYRSPFGVLSRGGRLIIALIFYPIAYFANGGLPADYAPGSNWHTDNTRWHNLEDNLNITINFHPVIDSIVTAVVPPWLIIHTFPASTQSPNFASPFALVNLVPSVAAFDFNVGVDLTNFQAVYNEHSNNLKNFGNFEAVNVDMFIQNGGEVSRANYEPFIDQFYTWLDGKGVGHTETLDATGRWLDYMCDHAEGNYAVT